MLCTELLEVLWNGVCKRDYDKIQYDKCIGSAISFDVCTLSFKSLGNINHNVIIIYCNIINVIYKFNA